MLLTEPLLRHPMITRVLERLTANSDDNTASFLFQKVVSELVAIHSYLPLV